MSIHFQNRSKKPFTILDPKFKIPPSLAFRLICGKPSLESGRFQDFRLINFLLHFRRSSDTWCESGSLSNSLATLCFPLIFFQKTSPNCKWTTGRQMLLSNDLKFYFYLVRVSQFIQESAAISIMGEIFFSIDQIT